VSFVAQLWLPTLVSAALVFVLSAASHMVLPWRRNEWGRITDAGPLQAALRDRAPGQYLFPAAPDPRQQLSKESVERWAQGPSGWVTIARPGPMRMGRSLALSFVVFLLVALAEAYLAAKILGPAPRHRHVFRLVGAVGFLSFGTATVFHSIWYHRPWRAYAADLLDALLFGVAMGVVFALLWPY
jgi:hypothetical protein